MKSVAVLGRRGAVASLLVAAGCLTSSPPLPPVRWFDPSPPPAELAASPVTVRAMTAPHLGREFVVRVGPRELALDSQHQWIAEPRELVAAVVARAFAGRLPAGATTELVLETFEFDVTAAPRAQVRFTLLGGRPEGVPVSIEASASAADRSPDALAEAMAVALAKVQAQLQPAR